MNLAHITILHLNLRLRVVPDTLHCHLRFLGLDLLEEIMALRATGAIGIRVHALPGGPVRRNEVTLTMQHLRQTIPGTS